jgi:hypothetical protein
MKKHAIRVAAVGAVTALVAAFAPVAAFAATIPTYDNTTDAPIYLISGADASPLTPGTQYDFNFADTALVSSVAVPDLDNIDATRTPVASDGALTWIAFIALPGDERTKANWKAWGDSSAIPAQGVLLGQVTPGYLGNGPNAASVKSNGGTYSLGIAYLKNNDLTVVSAYYTTINVDAGTGTWTFVNKPADVVITDVPTTTTLAADKSAVELGGSVTLTATVAASAETPSGNVEFYKGATKLATRALSAGTASYTVTPGTTGSQTYSATFVENTVGTDKFLASTSSDVSVDVTAATAALPPNAPTQSALNANTANDATASYDEATHKATLNVDAVNNGAVVNLFVYSTPTFLGQATVTDGKVSGDVSGLETGTHELAITNPDNGDVIAWASFEKTDAAVSPSISKTINAEAAAVAPSDGEFSLTNLSGDTVNLTNPAIVDGKSVVSGTLGSFKVTDLRQVSHPGWNLQTNVTAFTKGTDTIAASALGIKPTVIAQAGTGSTAPTLGDEQISGSASYPWDFATLNAGSYSGASTYDADLTFTAPAGKPAGTYTSTLTLTLISK